MVDLPLVHKDTAPLGDVKAIQIGVSCGTEEVGSSVRLRATRRSPCLPYPVLPTTLIRPSIRQQQIHGASPVWDGEGDEGGVSEGLQDEGPLPHLRRFLRLPPPYSISLPTVVSPLYTRREYREQRRVETVLPLSQILFFSKCLLNFCL